jgi:predicted nucleotidyltransferase component of viral defense system
MISDKEIEAKAAEFQLRPLEVQKDYVYGWLLKGLFQRPAFASQLVLKGGNALRKGYLPDTRFSKDLDFSAREGFPLSVLESELLEVCDFVAAQTGVQFTDKISVREKDLAIPEIQALEARLYFKSFYGQENLSLRTQLDITQFDRIYLPVQARQLLHGYSDQAACATIIQCHKLEEILASKLTTLLHRRNPADLFDLLYTIIFRDQFGVNRREVVTTFLRKSIFETQPIQPAFAPASADARLRRSMSLGGLRPVSVGFRNYFAADTRNTILAAGRGRTMVELTYDGHRRLVEPYKLEYYVRKKDGRGLEYFWGWDTTGGRSGKVGIKQFICDKIESVRSTTRPFQPRFVVEL